MPGATGSPGSEGSSNLYSDHEQTHHASDQPEPEQDAMDLSSDGNDNGIPLGENSRDASPLLPAVPKSPSVTFPSTAPNGHGSTPQLPMAPTGSAERYGLDTTQRKRKLWSQSGQDRPTPSPIVAGYHAGAVEGERTFPTQYHTVISPDSHHHKRPRLANCSRLPINSVECVPSDKSLLPGEIWQHVFEFVPPVSLGRLLRVNRAFKIILTPVEGDPFQRKETHGSVKFQAPNCVWTASRKHYCPGMPRPLSSFTEHEMWKLLLNPNCQFCGETGSVLPPLPTSPWESGPADHDVRIIWPFGVRCCGKCLKERTEKELDLVFSSLPSLLLAALPFTFMTQSFHVVSSVTLRSTSTPSGVQLVKYFFRPHIEDIKRQLEEAKSMGSATAEEWLKGLEAVGKSKLADAARWEHWEASGGLRALISRHGAKPKETESHATSLIASAAQIQKPPSSGGMRDSGSGQSTPSAHVRSANVSSNASPARMQFPQGNGLPPRPTSPQSRAPFPYSFPTHHQSQPRVERNIKEINEAKTARRAEIERRCQELDPPISPALLSHMESFQAAIQIPKPLTEGDWDVLKPRILAQKDIAERRENERSTHYQHHQVKIEERRQLEAHLRDIKDASDRDWEEVQKPIRERLGSYADEAINDKWDGGASVTKEKCPSFAADVLLYVRDRFYGDIEREDQAARAASLPVDQDLPNAPPKRKIVLENMKWVFDTKVKPLTEHYQKELFLCNGCDNNSKFYGFEGVIQHYAAKHTSVLSMGSIVVHWRAEWPDIPPFHPHPSVAKYSHYGYSTPAMTTASTAGSGSMGQPQHYMAGDQGSVYPQPSPGPYGRPPYVGQYPQYSSDAYKAASPDLYSGPYQPPAPPYQTPAQNYGYGQGNNYGPTNVPYGNFPGQYQPPQAHMYGSPYPGTVYPVQMSIPESMPTPTFASTQFVQPAHPGYPTYPMQSQAIAGGNPAPNGQPGNLHQAQLMKLAEYAREVWNATSGVKDMPGSVRTYVVIQHVVLKFKNQYTNEPNLGLFTDGLNTQAQMRPLRSINGLACKACANGMSDMSAFLPHPQPPHSEKKLYTLPALLSHFQAVHIERAKPAVVPQTGIETPRLDWKHDMIELPKPAALLDLIHSPGMDDAKLRLVAEVIDNVFPSPLPKFTSLTRNVPIPVIKEEFQSDSGRVHVHDPSSPARPVSPYHADSFQRPDSQSHSPNPRAKGLEVTVDGYARFVDSPMYEPSQPEPPRDDEYDPHRPAPVPIADVCGRGERRRFQLRRSPPAASEFADKDNASSVSSLRRYDGRPSNAPSEMDYDRRYRPSESHRPRDSSDAFPTTSPDQPMSRDHSSYGYEARPPVSIYDESPGRGRSVAKYRSAIGAGTGEAELSTPYRRDDARMPNEPSEEVVNAAERFLDKLNPKPAVEDEKAKATDYINSPAHRSDEYSRNRWAKESGDDERRKYAPDSRDSRTWREANHSAAADNSMQGTPTQLPSSNGWGTKRISPLSGYPYEYKPERPDDGLGAIREHSPEYDPRTVRAGTTYHEAPRQSADHHGKRPSSRFDRYEAQLQPSYRGRSRSPRSREPTVVEATYQTYRERSPPHPRHVYHTESPEYRDRRSIDDPPVAYTRIPSQSYQYVDQPRYVEVPQEHRGPVQYIEVREPPPYYIERPVQREILRYEGEYSDQPQIYRVSAPRGQEVYGPQHPLPRQYRRR